MFPLTLPHRRFFYIRHGQTDWNAQGLWQGQKDIPLNAVGEEQAHKAALLLKNIGITRIIASPLKRAAVTAEIIDKHLQVGIEFDGYLKERNYGAFEGQPWRKVLTDNNLQESDSIEPYMPLDSENWPALQRRMQKAIAYWLTSYPNDVLLFVGHGASYRAFYESYFTGSMHAGNCVPLMLEHHASGWEHRTLAT